jgi:hypothetical protein
MLIAWLPASLIIWTGLRSVLFDSMQNPNFPVMAPLENNVPLAWLGYYIMLIPLFHYAWIRLAQPFRGSFAGVAIAVAVFVSYFRFYYALNVSNMLWWSSRTLLLLMAIFLIYSTRKLIRSLEVRS